MSIGERIRYKRKLLGLSADDVAKLLDVDRSTIYRYESDEIEKLPITIIQPLAKALRVHPAYLMGWEEESDSVRLKKIPMLGTIAAGEPILAEGYCEYYVEADEDINADFCIKVKGDSMINARILDGDLVFIRKQPDVDDGEIAAVMIDGEATLKRVYKVPGRIQLRAENPAFKPIEVKEDDYSDVKILGKAVFFQSEVK